MKEEIEDMIGLLRIGVYDPEAMHSNYDKLLEKFILTYDPSLVPLMKELIEIEKEFWYA